MKSQNLTWWLVVLLILSATTWERADAQTAQRRNFERAANAPLSSNGEAAVGGTFYGFAGLDGSKQPQDFGVNANLGGQFRLNYSAPLVADRGIGFQIGTAVVAQGNAVQVYELLGEAKDRLQNFSTVGIFQRTESGFGWGGAYDFLYQDSFDKFNLGQWRATANFRFSQTLEIGTTVNLIGQSDQGFFNDTLVEVEPIEMLHIYVDKAWSSGVMTKFWIGVADGHNENNAVTGSLPRKQNQLLTGAEFTAPLNNWMSIYGEANVIFPADTGSVDAFLGVEFVPGGVWRKTPSNRFRPMFSVASSPTFSSDLLLR